MTCSATYNSEKVTEAAVERCFLKTTTDKVWEKKIEFYIVILLVNSLQLY